MISLSFKKCYVHKILGIYYKPIRVGNFWNNNYIEYESNGDINKNLSVKEYLNEIKERERERERENILTKLK